jgi:hypothetical protein
MREMLLALMLLVSMAKELLLVVTMFVGTKLKELLLVIIAPKELLFVT